VEVLLLIWYLALNKPINLNPREEMISGEAYPREGVIEIPLKEGKAKELD
jgi:hypothetical protein